MRPPDVLVVIWDEVTDTQAALGHQGVVATAALALLVVVVPQLWGVARHAITIAHEGAHGVAALASGRRLSGIRLHSDTSGLTVSRGKPRRLGMVATAFAGYPGPALIGLGAAWLLSRQHALAVLWLTVLLLTLVLLQIRNFYGLWVVAVAGAAVFAVTWWGSGQTQTAAAHAGTWFLLLGAPRPVLELQAKRRAGRARSSDADVLARLTGVPAIGWAGLFLLVTLGALAVGALLLLGSVR